MKILIVGVSVRAMAASAVGSGYPVLALDAFGDQDLKSIAESYGLHRDFHMRYSPEALYRASRGLSYDAVAYTSNLENHPGIIGRIADGRKIIGNSLSVVRSVRTWPGLYSRLRRAGFRIPETLFTNDSRQADPGRRWLCKPVSGGGGHGIFFWTAETPAGKGCMIQEHLRGKSCSASFLANGRECVLVGIAGQLIGSTPFGAHGFHYCGNILPLPEAADPGRQAFLVDHVRRLATFLTGEYSLTGVNCVDFMLDEEQLYVTEVNPRYSASMELIERAYALPIFHLHTQAVLHGTLPAFRLEDALGSSECFGKAILFAERNAVAPDTKGWLDSGVRDIPAPRERLRKGSPVCTILADGPTYEETMEELVRKAGLLKGKIYG